MGYIIGRQVPSHCSKSSRWAAQVCPSAVAHLPIARWVRYLLRLAFLSYCLSARCITPGLSTYCSRLRIGRREGGRPRMRWVGWRDRHIRTR